MKKKKNIDSTTINEYEQSMKNLKMLRKVMIGMDIFAIFVLILQIIIKDVSYSSYIVLILCNIITFCVKPKKDK